MRRDLVLGSARELGTVGLVAGLSGCYAGVLVTTSSFLSRRTASVGGSSGAMLQVVSTVFILIAVYVAAVVIVNAVDTVLAGRLAQIALLRLLGARASTLRAAVMRGVASVGTLSAVAGAVVGTSAADLLRVVLVAPGAPAGHRTTRSTSAWLVVPVLTIGAASALAGRVGVAPGPDRLAGRRAWAGPRVPRPVTRRDSTRPDGRLAAARRGRLRSCWSWRCCWARAGTLAGFLVAALGSMTASSGLLVGARLVIPGLVGLASRLLGRTPAARIAGRNAVKDPLRTTRSTMGLVIGVTLVTTFASGLTALRHSVHSWPDLTAAQEAHAESSLTITTQVLVAVVVDLVADLGRGLRQHHVADGDPAAARDRPAARAGAHPAAGEPDDHPGVGRALGHRDRLRDRPRDSSSARSARRRSSVATPPASPGDCRGSCWPGTVVGALALVLAAARPPARRAVRVTPVEALRVT